MPLVGEYSLQAPSRKSVITITAVQDVARAPSFLVRQPVPRNEAEQPLGMNPLVRPLPARRIRE